MIDQPPSEIIQSSRWKAALYLLVALLFIAVSPLLIRSSNPGDHLVGWGGLLFFGVGGLVFAWALIRPMKLQLDSQGFTLSGGLVRKPRRELWSDVTEFYVWKLPRGGKVVGYNYVPGARKPSVVRKFTQGFGAEAALPKGWQLNPEQLVDRLNAYREKALQLVL